MAEFVVTEAGVEFAQEGKALYAQAKRLIDYLPESTIIACAGMTDLPEDWFLEPRKGNAEPRVPQKTKEFVALIVLMALLTREHDEKDVKH